MYKAMGLLFVIISFSSADWQRMCGSSSNPVPPQKRVMQSDSSCVRIATICFGFTADDTLIDGKTFQRIVIPYEEVDQDQAHAGMPQIPYIRMTIAVPDSCEFSVSVDGVDNNTITDLLLYPVPRIVFDDTGGLIRAREVYTYDTLFYEKETLYPNKMYDIVNVGHWRDQRIMEINLYPVQFDPNDQIIYITSRMELTIKYQGDVVFDSSGLGPFEGLARDILLNYQGIDRQPPVHPAPAVHYYTDLLDPDNVADYIIVTHESFLLNETTAPKINEFAQWRVDHNDFDVAVVSMANIKNQFEPQNHDSTQLKNFLIHAYENWHAYAVPDDHFAYCLFIGDWDYVPTVLGSYTMGEYDWLGADDHYYADLIDGGGNDIMLGRWPVKVGKWQDLVTVADKIINYEQYPALGDWRRDVFLTAGHRGDGDGPVGFTARVLQCVPYVLDIGYDTITVTKFIGPDIGDSLTNGEYRDSVQKYFNTGSLLATYIDHGDPKGWDSYDTTQLKALRNDTHLPVVFSNACLTAMFQWDNPFYDQQHMRPHSDSSFGELMLVNPEGGVVAFWGATVFSYIPAEQNWCKNMFVYQNWHLGYSADARPCPDFPGCYCLLGDPALDLGDYTAYPNLPDLVIRPTEDDIRLLDPYPYPASNATIPISAKIINIGHVSAANIPVRFRVLLQEDLLYENTVLVNQVMPRDSALATVNWNTSLTHPNFVGTLGNCEVEVTIDPDQEIPESWKLNNRQSVMRKIVFYPYLAGWPKKVSQYSQPALGNVNGLGEVEIAYASRDSIYIFRPNGVPFGNWPKYFKGVTGLTLANVNLDGNLEIIAYSPDSLKIYNQQGNLLPGWPVAMLPSLSGYQYYALPSVGHIDGANSWSIVVIARDTIIQNHNQSLHILAYAINGQCIHDITTAHPICHDEDLISVSIDDVLASGSDYDEIVISQVYYDGPDPDKVFCTEIFNNSGSVRTLNYGSTGTIGLYDINANGYADLVIGDADGNIKAYDAQNNALIWEQPADPGCQIRSSPVVGDIHPTPGVEISFGTDFPKAHLRQKIDGATIDPWPDSITGTVRTSDAIGHINGDANLDIITATQGFYLYAHSYDRIRIGPYPLPFFGFLSSPVLGDINGDRRNEVIISTADGYLHVLKNTNSWIARYSVEWPQFHHDYQHTGVFGGP